MRSPNHYYFTRGSSFFQSLSARTKLAILFCRSALFSSLGRTEGLFPRLKTPTKKAIGKTNRFKLMLYSHPKNRTKEKQGEERKVIGQALGLLVLPGTHITVLTPAAYQPGSLPGTLLAYAMGNLILRLASRLDAFSVYPIRT